jgi:uncharacterized protein (TIGR02996 family)
VEGEKGFLRAIAASPDDDTTRLVYADWLEERGDLRAEYLRVEYRVRVEGTKETSLLMELRSQLDTSWLRAVRDGRLGRDWVIVLQSLGSEQGVVIATLRQLLRMGERAAAAAVQGRPSELQRGLRYGEAQRLREQFGDAALVTVEFRPHYSSRR